MITGDHADTAVAIGRQLGLRHPDSMLRGKDIDTIKSADELATVVRTVDVFARTSPEHKLRLVQALKENGEIVAMTGDGVNDAPALSQADIGVAMGMKGTEVAKQAAAMVLGDDNFAAVALAVQEGRAIDDKLRKTIAFFLSLNGAESFSVIVSVLIGQQIPITPLLILWVNLVSSVCLALVLPFDEPDVEALMNRPPKSPKRSLVDRFTLWRIIFVTFLFVLGVFGVYEWSLFYSPPSTPNSSSSSIDEADPAIRKARTAAVNTLIMMEAFYLLNIRHLSENSFTWKRLKGSGRAFLAIAVTLCLQAVLTFAPFMHTLFGTMSLEPLDILLIFTVSFVSLLIVAFEKMIRKVWKKTRKNQENKLIGE